VVLKETARKDDKLKTGELEITDYKEDIICLLYLYPKSDWV
jgi:hypothetical protein